MSHVIFKREALFNPDRYYIEHNLTTVGETSNQALYFKPDGTRVYYGGLTSDRVRSYDLSTPWDLRTATNNLSSSDALYDPTGAIFGPYCFNFNLDGSKLLVGGISGSSGSLAVYTLNTPWNIATINVTASQFSGNIEAGAIQGISLSANQDKLLLTYQKATGVRLYNISSSLDLTTFQLSSSAGGGSSNNFRGCSFADDGKKIFFAVAFGSYASAMVYTVTTPYTLEGFTLFKQQQNVASAYGGGNTFQEVYAKNDGIYYYGLSSVLQRIIQWKVL